MLIKIICGFFIQRRHSIKGLVIDGISRKFSIEISLAWPGDVDGSFCKSRSGIQTKMWRYIGWWYIEVLHGESQFWGGQGLKTRSDSRIANEISINSDSQNGCGWCGLSWVQSNFIHELITFWSQLRCKFHFNYDQWLLWIFGNVSGIESQFLCLLFDV